MEEPTLLMVQLKLAMADGRSALMKPSAQEISIVPTVGTLGRPDSVDRKGSVPELISEWIWRP